MGEIDQRKAMTAEECREIGRRLAHRPEWGKSPPLWHTALTQADWEVEAYLMEQDQLFTGQRAEPDNELLSIAVDVLAGLDAIEDRDKLIATINAIRAEIHKRSPFATEPVDFVQWVPFDSVQANDYNPNSVAPPEMELLEHSISEDGYTQPIVAWEDDERFEVVDGFHRNRVGRESAAVGERIGGYLPLAVVNDSRTDRGDRIAATIRHNRARGKHKVESMSDIVLELKRRNWSDKKIGKELGMDADEVLRLTQIQGLAEMFADRDFSEAWEAEQIMEDDNLEIAEESE